MNKKLRGQKGTNTLCAMNQTNGVGGITMRRP